MFIFLSFKPGHETLLPLFNQTTLNRTKVRQSFLPHRVLSLEFEPFLSVSLCRLHLLDLLHRFIVASDLLVDEHLYAPTEG